MCDTVKKCNLCGEVKSTDEFYKDNRASDGCQSACKSCWRNRVNARYAASSDFREKTRKWVSDYKKKNKQKWNEAETRRRWKDIDRRRDQGRRSYHRNKDRVLAYQREYRSNNPDKISARKAVSLAIASGDLIPGVCTICGNGKVEAHHPDYSQPLNVVWLCPRDHARHHAGLLDPPLLGLFGLMGHRGCR